MGFSIGNFTQDMSKGVIAGAAVGALSYGLNYLGIGVTLVHPLATGVALGLNNALTKACGKELRADGRINTRKELIIREIFCRVLALSVALGAYALVNSLDYQASLITGGLLTVLSLSNIFSNKEKKGLEDF